MIKQILSKFNIAALNEMQQATISASKSHKNLVLLSPTGSGKTLGFLLSSLQQIKPQREGIQTLILAPSRELALQIEQVFRKMDTGHKVNCCYGGHDMKIEKNNLSVPPTVLIGTPGRIADHIRRDHINLTYTTSLILDEFDKALEFGFGKEMEFIIGEMHQLSRRILTSATQLDDIPEYVKLSSPKYLDFTEGAAPSKLELKAVRATGHDKLELLYNLICTLENKPMLIFCNHRDAVDRISDLLHSEGIHHDMFHGGLKQEERERALIKFRNGSYNILLTTDLASRGLDIPEIKYVLHYQLPRQEDVFIHRNGRTARMNADGTAFLILAKEEYIPPFIEEEVEVVPVQEDGAPPEKPEWATLYIGGGKKDKINKIDVVGFLFKKGQLQKDELGKIEVLDYSAYAAVKRNKIKKVVSSLRNEKLKRKKVKIDISK